MPASIFARAVGFRMLMLNADKGGGSGGGEKAKTIPELTQRVTALETENQTLTTDLATATTAKTDLQTQLTAAESAKTELQTKLTAAETAKTELQTKLTAAESAKTELQTKLTTAETAKTTAETATTAAKQETQVAQTKANETAAKAGLKAPFTQTTAEQGKKDAGDETSGKTPREKLASFCKVAGE